MLFLLACDHLNNASIFELRMHFFHVFDADHFSCVFIAIVSIEDPQNIVDFRVEAPYNNFWEASLGNILILEIHDSSKEPFLIFDPESIQTFD